MTNPWAAAQPPGRTAEGFWQMGGLAQEAVPLPIHQTMQNSDLLTTCTLCRPSPTLAVLSTRPAADKLLCHIIDVKLISPFKASIDGNPDASNPYMKYHVPYCVQSPLLVHVAIYTAACFLSDTGHIDLTVAMSHKVYAIQQLNEHIRATAAIPSDEGITGVVQLIADEWYWGDANNLHTHLRGLREMIKLRGGFRQLGLHGLISKLAIT